MHRRNDPRVVAGRIASTGLVFLSLLAAGAAYADVKPHAGMLRYPAISADKIAFVYANNLWLAPHDGGVATPLASPPGMEGFPRFSADGQTIAFIGNYEGGRDIYTIPIAGGIPTRVTHHPGGEVLCGWTPDGKLLFYMSGNAGLTRQSELYTVSPAGGLPEKLPVPYGAFGSISPDGTWLAYTLHTADFRTWKRYRGGMATDIWLFNLKDHSAKKITDWEGTDTQPMWLGDKIYYLSDADATHHLNVWVYDTKTEKREQVTKLTDWDCKWPSMGPGPRKTGEIIFQYGADLLLLDLASKQTKKIEITIPGDRPRLVEQTYDAASNVYGFDISPSAKRAVFEGRGDIWTVPAENGTPRQITHTNGVYERSPGWSPDGKWIAYFADNTGEYELYIMQSDGLGETRQLTHNATTWKMGLSWSPDSKHIAYVDRGGKIWLANLEGKEDPTLVDADPQGNPSGVSWSHDSSWLAFTRGVPGSTVGRAVVLYNVAEKKATQVTSGMFSDSSPTFDHKGDFLAFASARNFSQPVYEDLGTTFVYSGVSDLYLVPLRKDVASPFLPKIDEETIKKDEAASQPSSGPASSSAPATASASAPASTSSPASTSAPADSQPATKPLVIDLEGFEARAIRVPVERGNFGGIGFNNDNKLLYVRGLPQGVEGKPSLKFFDPSADKKEEKTVMDGVGNYALTTDGKKLLVQHDGAYSIVDAAPDQKGDKSLALNGNMPTHVDPRSEWKQLLVDTWRLERDFFYVANMHGLNWEKIRDAYLAMVDDCASREDLRYVISEMISELNVGHAYYWGGPAELEPQRSVGLLGCDFELADGAYRIKKIYHGGDWDVDARGPLSQPGVRVKEGEYVLAVNGVPLDTTRDPWASFANLAGKTVSLTVSEKPKKDDDARSFPVTLLGDDSHLRFRSWIERNRAYVASKTDGKVGYIYVPNTGVDGQSELVRQFYTQLDKAALIVDERWNAGGQIPTRFVELLNRKVTSYYARRDGEDWPWPPDANFGPKCMLINGLAGSGGDAFPYYFKQSGAGKLIGTRTWGGLVGINGSPPLQDGTEITVPAFAFYKLNGHWGIEGHGVDPDIEVQDDPSKMMDGGDPQLDAGIKLMLDELKAHPFTRPQRPAAPDKTGMGIKDEDK